MIESAVGAARKTGKAARIVKREDINTFDSSLSPQSSANELLIQVGPKPGHQPSILNIPFGLILFMLSAIR